MFLADACVHFTGKKSYHAYTMSSRFANWNQQNVTNMFQEHLHILAMVELATVARIKHHVDGQSIRIGE